MMYTDNYKTRLKFNHTGVFIFITCVGLIEIYLALNFYVGSTVKVLYGITLLFVFLYILLNIINIHLKLYFWIIISFALLLSVIWTIPAFVGLPTPAKYYAADFAVIWFPILLYVFGNLRKELFFGRAPHKYLITILIIAAFISPVGVTHTHRFVPPSLFLISFVIVSVTQPISTMKKVFVYILFGTILFLSLFSGERSATILLPGLLILGLLVRKPIIYMTIGLFILASIFILSSSITSDIANSSVIAKSRYADIIRGKQDVSLYMRYLEAKDVSNTFKDRGSYYNYLCGFGFGALFKAVHTESIRDIDSKGYAHQIHIGPVLVIFRYGIIGLIIYLYLWFYVVHKFYSIWKSRNLHDVSKYYLRIFSTASLAYMISSLVFNVFSDILFSYSLIGLIIGSQFIIKRKKKYIMCDFADN